MAKGTPKRGRKTTHPEAAKLLAECRVLLGDEAVVPTKQGHYKVLVPGEGIVLVAGSPSDHRSVSNARSRLRQRGLDV